ncbi:MAG: LexA family protein [Propionibacteriaceae bacterium]
MAAAWPSPARDYVSAPLRLDDHLITNPASTFILRATSDSPVSLGIRRGDELIVDRTISPAPGDIVIGIIDDEFRFGSYLAGGRLRTSSGLVSLHEVWGVVTYVLHPTRQKYSR